MIQTLDEAQDNAKEGTDKYQTWKFKASNIRDFAFATSRRFIWDAMGVKMNDGRTCLLYTSPSPRDQRGARMPSSA